jgi:hypothetical protein
MAPSTKIIRRLLNPTAQKIQGIMTGSMNIQQRRPPMISTWCQLHRIALKTKTVRHPVNQMAKKIMVMAGSKNILHKTLESVRHSRLHRMALDTKITRRLANQKAQKIQGTRAGSMNIRHRMSQ